jgi:GTP-binding protein YchF
MRLAIVGPRLSGKTTLFNALTGLNAATGVGADGSVHLGVFDVPDPRFDRLTRALPYPTTTPARIEMVDIPGFSEVAAGGGGGRGLDEKILHEARNADGLILLVRSFAQPSVPHPSGTIDPIADLNAAWADMLIADQASAEKRLATLKPMAAKGGAGTDEKHELAALERVVEHLESGQGLSGLDLGEEEARLLRGFGFLTAKPLFIIINIGEEGLPPETSPEWREWGVAHGAEVIAICAGLAAELARMDPDDADAFAREYGVELNATESVIRTAYETLNVVTFYTATGEKEVRAWTHPRGATALEAAGSIHSDMAKGFIRAEVIGVDELIEAGSIAAARKSGLLRQEGKTYLVEDGDILNIKFAP